MLRSAFLMVSWALPADVNFESELNRWMGPGRKDLVIVKKILQMPSYSGRIELEVVTGAPRVPCVPGCGHCRLPSDLSVLASPEAGPEAAAAAVDTGAGVTPGVPAAAAAADASASSPSQALRSPSTRLGTPGETGPAVVTERVVVDDDMFLFNAISLPDIAHNIRMAPFAHPSDGLMDIILFRRSACSACPSVLSTVGW
jgi:hypothetical protein